MRRWIRAGFVCTAALGAVVAVGLFQRQEWARSVWPWPAGPISYVFLSAVVAAIVAPMLWVALSEEWGASAGSALFPCILFGALAVRGLLAADATPAALAFGLGCAALAVSSAGTHLWGCRIALRDSRPTPAPVRWSFALFVIVLVAGGAALAQGRPIMPWPVTQDTAMGFGWVFLGAASSYVYALRYPRWHYARGPLLGFLAYDLVLLPRLIGLFGTGRPELRVSLMIYTAVVVFSGLLGTYYLVLDRSTRGWLPAAR